MVICFVPGSGGHRYKRSLIGLSYNTVGGHMHDNTVKELQLYCNDTTEIAHYSTDSIVLTHTMNSLLIAQKFPDHNVIKLKTDYKKSILREWDTVIKPNSNNWALADHIDQMFQLIKWHKEYYDQYPIDYAADQVIDIDTADTEFARVMRRELNIQNYWFDFAWDTFEKYGSDAPVIDLANDSASVLLVNSP
jgi:hypothetical protein